MVKNYQLARNLKIINIIQQNSLHKNIWSRRLMKNPLRKLLERSTQGTIGCGFVLSRTCLRYQVQRNTCTHTHTYRQVGKAAGVVSPRYVDTMLPMFDTMLPIDCLYESWASLFKKTKTTTHILYSKLIIAKGYHTMFTFPIIQATTIEVARTIFCWEHLIFCAGSRIIFVGIQSFRSKFQ